MFKNVIVMSMLALFIISCSESTSPSTTTPTPETSKDKFIVDAEKDGYVLVTGEKANLVDNGSLMNEDNTVLLYEYVEKTTDDKRAIYKKGTGEFFGVTLIGSLNANGDDTRELFFYLDRGATIFTKYWDNASNVDFTDDENLAKAELRLSMGTPVVVDSDGSASDISFTEYKGNRYILAEGNSGVALYKETGTVWRELVDRSHNSSTKSGSSLQVVGDDFVSVIYKTGLPTGNEIGIRKNTDTGISSTEQFGSEGIKLGFFDKTISTVVVDNEKVVVAYDTNTWNDKNGGVVLTTTMAGENPVQVSYNAGYTKPKATVLKRKNGDSVVNLFAIDPTGTLKVMIGNTVAVGLELAGVKAYDVVTTSNLKQNYLIASTTDNISIYRSTGSSWESMAVVVADFEADYIDVAIVDDNFLYILYMENKENDTKALIRKYKISGDTAILMSDRSASPKNGGLPKIGYVQGKVSVVYDVFARFRTDIADVKETIIYYEMPE